MESLSPRIINAKILVVDDVELNRFFIQESLKKRGFTNIITATNGEDALEKTRLFHPDIVLLDLMMPIMDGFTYCEHIRKDPDFSMMPIIAQTASDDREDKLRALSCGADDFVMKPVDQSELFLRVCLHLHRYKLLRETSEMREYLTLELERAQDILSQIQHTIDPKEFSLLGDHYEALEMISQPN